MVAYQYVTDSEIPAYLRFFGGDDSYPLTKSNKVLPKVFAGVHARDPSKCNYFGSQCPFRILDFDPMTCDA